MDCLLRTLQNSELHEIANYITNDIRFYALVHACRHAAWHNVCGLNEEPVALVMQSATSFSSEF